MAVGIGLCPRISKTSNQETQPAGWRMRGGKKQKMIIFVKQRTYTPSIQNYDRGKYLESA